MRLPFSTELGYFNLVLSAVVTLSEGQDSCDVHHLVKLCRTRIFDGQYFEYTGLMNLMAHAGFLVLKKGRASITDAGREFLWNNPSLSFDLTPSQKALFTREIILSGPWEKLAKRVLSNFLPNYREVTFEFPISALNSLEDSIKAAFHLFWVLELLTKVGDMYQVNPMYVKHVNITRAPKTQRTQTELEDLIAQNRQQGIRAEEIIVDFERQRLQSLGRHAEADRVIRISDLEANAGFDIKSFNGDQPSLDYDRFIEVKSSFNNHINFYWSLNEIEKSKQLTNSYWIYFLGGFKAINTKGQIEPIMIQNPTAVLFKNSDFRVSPTKYQVTQLSRFK